MKHTGDVQKLHVGSWNERADVRDSWQRRTCMIEVANTFPFHLVRAIDEPVKWLFGNNLAWNVYIKFATKILPESIEMKIYKECLTLSGTKHFIIKLRAFQRIFRKCWRFTFECSELCIQRQWLKSFVSEHEISCHLSIRMLNYSSIGVKLYRLTAAQIHLTVSQSHTGFARLHFIGTNWSHCQALPMSCVRTSLDGIAARNSWDCSYKFVKCDTNTVAKMHTQNERFKHISQP